MDLPMKLRLALTLLFRTGWIQFMEPPASSSRELGLKLCNTIKNISHCKLFRRRATFLVEKRFKSGV